MGIPAFFRWLTNKFPQIVQFDQKENDTNLENTKEQNVQIEFDNLYIDMNGIIHNSSHQENKAAPLNEEQIIKEIYLYIDDIFSRVRPRKLIYIAIDGVAPRAKMNQQRSRRFQAVKEARDKQMIIERLKLESLNKGIMPIQHNEASIKFDNNCITPGTSFMTRISDALQFYIYNKLNSDPEWKDLQVIFNDEKVPGEGEHKIMNFIRRQRNKPNYDPNTKHCMYGPDSDLVMLGLATHEPIFSIIREEVKPFQPQPCEICGRLGHTMKECSGEPNTQLNIDADQDESEKSFIFLHLHILREYLKQELIMIDLPIPYDFERAVDDWVFMSFFVGNDFLPRLPSLEIRERALERLITVYKASVYKHCDWLTNSGQLNLHQLQSIMNDLASSEDEIFQKRRALQIKMIKTGMYRSRAKNTKLIKTDDKKDIEENNTESVIEDTDKQFSQLSLLEEKDPQHHSLLESQDPKGDNRDSIHHKLKERIDKLDERDEVRLWTDGYRERYYLSKFGVSIDENPEFPGNVAHAYLTGLCWMLSYYYQGCASWKWYYPFHYAPFAADFTNLPSANIHFEKHTKPFYPLQQLMAVFPAGSKSHVPLCWQHLMTDLDSPIIDFYPNEIVIDLNGKQYEWQGVTILPFVDETRLLSVLDNHSSLLKDDERSRNVFGSTRYFVKSDHKAASVIKVLYESEHNQDTIVDLKIEDDVAGRIWSDVSLYQLDDTIQSPISSVCDNISNVQVLSCFFEDPEYPEDFMFHSGILPNAVLPQMRIKRGLDKKVRKYLKGNKNPKSNQKPTSKPASDETK